MKTDDKNVKDTNKKPEPNADYATDQTVYSEDMVCSAEFPQGCIVEGEDPTLDIDEKLK